MSLQRKRHQWFAWYPGPAQTVTDECSTELKWVWLRTVIRREVWSHDALYGIASTWAYEELK